NNVFHNQPHLPPRGIHHHHSVIPIQRLNRFQSQGYVHTKHFSGNIADRHHHLAVNFFNLIYPNPPDFLNVSKWNGKHGLTTADEQRLRDNQCERDLQSETSATAQFRVNFNFTVQRHQVGANHIESHAASGQFGLAWRSGEAGLEQQIEQLFLSKRLGSIGIKKTDFHRNLADLFVINAPPIIFHFHKNVVAAMVCPDSYSTDITLALLVANVFPFNSVCHSVAHQMDQRVRNLLDDVVIEFCFSALQLEFCAFPGSFGGIAHRSRKTSVQIPNRHHARLRDFILQAMRQLGELVNIGINTPDKPPKLRQDFADVGGNFRQGPGENVEIIIPVHFELAELGMRLARQRSIAGEWNAVSGNEIVGRAHARHVNAAEFVLFLELADFFLHARTGKIQHVSQVL